MLAAGAVFAVSTMGLAAKPGGFEAPPAKSMGVALPPVVEPLDEDEVDEADEGVDDPSDTLDEPIAGSDSGSAAGRSADFASMPLVDPEWTSRTADATGIPERALEAYALAHVLTAVEQEECGLDWTTLAAIGAIESQHGDHGSTVLDADGFALPAILGPALDGDGVAKITDTDGGTLDQDTTWDRAVGPMQFIPSTWAEWGTDANGDGIADPNQIDDAAVTTAMYLCASGSMTTPEGWRAAVYSYNHDNDYVDDVAEVANDYAASAE